MQSLGYSNTGTNGIAASHQYLNGTAKHSTGTTGQGGADLPTGAPRPGFHGNTGQALHQSNPKTTTYQNGNGEMATMNTLSSSTGAIQGGALGQGQGTGQGQRASSSAVDDTKDDSEHDDEGEPSKRKGSQGEEGSTRVQLACFYCRSKRIRCSGTKPICTACEKASVPCEWPSGRRKKRTRKEMEEAKRLEAEANMSVGGSGQYPGQTMMQGQQQMQMQVPQMQGMIQMRGQQGQGQTQQGMMGIMPLQAPQNLQQQQDQQGMMGTQQMGGFEMPMMMSTGFTPMTNMFEGDDSNASLTTTTFDPDFWTLPAGSSTGPGTAGNNGNGGTNNNDSNTSFTGNYVWPSGFTPDNNPVMPSDPLEPTMKQFMTSPATDMRLISALENQAAYIQGNPGEDEDLELFYYRFSGATAVQPGIHRISLKLQRRGEPGDSPMTAAPQSEDDVKIPTPSRAPVADIFDASGMVLMHVWEPLFELFLTHMSQHFPSVSRMRMQERFETGTMSQFLAACICACGARFSSDAKDRQTQACAPFIAKAQELIIPLVHLPTTEVTTGLLMLAWANYGQNSESGLWQYSGMSIRMGIDIGIHENSEVYESPAHVIRTRHLFWTLFITDRVVAFSTGRPASIPEDIIEVPLPEDKDFFPDPSRNTPGYPTENVEPVPFVYYVRLMIICGRISNVLNGRRGRARTLVNAAEPLAEQLAELQMKLVQFVANLPASLKWSADNFKHQHTRGHGGAFLSLHLWAHAVLALIYHPELLKSPSGIETPLNRGMNRNIKLSLASSRQICECMVFADLVAPSSYISTPFIVQPLFVASMALIHEMRAVQAAESSGNPTDVFLLSMARQNLTALMTAVGKMEEFWAGTSYVAQILEKRSGFKTSSRRGRKTFISLPDTGLLRRFTTDKDHPKDVAPATQTSLRESIAKSERQKSSPFWLSDLMAGYTVENMSFTPADSFDIERLLGSAGMGGWGMTPAQPQQQGQMGQLQGQAQGQGQLLGGQDQGGGQPQLQRQVSGQNTS